MKVGIKKLENFKGDLPSYSREGDACIDLRAQLDTKGIMIHPGERKLLSTGLAFEIPTGYEMQIRPRSGWALKEGITVLNSPGTIDSNYRGPVGIILINHGRESVVIRDLDRIAQGALVKVETMEFEVKEELSETVRSDSGFGSSGVK